MPFIKWVLVNVIFALPLCIASLLSLFSLSRRFVFKIFYLCIIPSDFSLFLPLSSSLNSWPFGNQDKKKPLSRLLPCRGKPRQDGPESSCHTQGKMDTYCILTSVISVICGTSIVEAFLLLWYRKFILESSPCVPLPGHHLCVFLLSHLCTQNPF